MEPQLPGAKKTRLAGIAKKCETNGTVLFAKFAMHARARSALSVRCNSQEFATVGCARSDSCLSSSLLLTSGAFSTIGGLRARFCVGYLSATERAPSRAGLYKYDR